MTPASLAALAAEGGEVAVRVTPKARANKVMLDDRGLRVSVTTAPEDGKANAAVIALLARELKLPKSALTLVRGARGRDKLIRIEPPAARAQGGVRR